MHVKLHILRILILKVCLSFFFLSDTVFVFLNKEKHSSTFNKKKIDRKKIKSIFIGKLPTWLINRVTKVVAPKALKKLHKASINYPTWKNKHNPNWKPWIFPDQLVSYFFL